MRFAAFCVFSQIEGGIVVIKQTLLHLKSAYPSLRPAEQRVAAKILADPHGAVNLSITKLAQAAQVSDATVVKFCKRLGYQGFKEFKLLLAQDVVYAPEPARGEILPDDDLTSIKEKVFYANILALQNTAKMLEEGVLQSAAEALAKAGEIQFYALGASGLAAVYGEQKFSRTGMRARAVLDPCLQLVRAALLKPGDAVVALSHSGETEEISQAVLAGKDVGALTIAVTDVTNSKLAQRADLVLISVAPEDPLPYAAFPCPISQLSIIDTLFTAVALVNEAVFKAAVLKGERALSRHRPKRLRFQGPGHGQREESADSRRGGSDPQSIKCSSDPV